MKAIIIEDENSAVENLKFLLQEIIPELLIMEVIDTVSEAIDFLSKRNDFDLIFMDIHLADGNSFEIFKSIKPTAPIIFTTAYDQYAIQAFKVNSIDYLLKPIQETELKNAVQKFKRTKLNADISIAQIQNLMYSIQGQPKKYRQSYLVQRGDTLIPIAVQDFAFFFIQNGVVRGTTIKNNTYHIDGKLEDVETELKPDDFFRVNRQYLVQRSAIKDLTVYFNGRLIVNTLPETTEPIIASKATVPKLKAWLNTY